MKKNIIIFLIFIINITILFSEECDILFLLKDGEVRKITVDKNKTELVFSKADFGGKGIVTIKGLDQLDKLESFTLYFVRYMEDYTFLKDIKHIKDLGLISVPLSSLKFLEDFSELERAEISLVMDIKDKEKFEVEKINLSKLKKLQSLDIQALYIENNKYAGILSHIPKFINVKNSPKLILNWNEIKKITLKDKWYLRQFSDVYIAPVR